MLNILKVMTCNIGDLSGYRIISSEKVVDFLKLCGVPDVLLLQEVRSEYEAQYISDKLGLKYFVFLNDLQQIHGIAILSRFSLLNSDQIYFKTSKYGYGAVAADVMPGHGDADTDTLNITQNKIQVVNVHMDRIDNVTMKGKKIAVNLSSVLGFVKNEILGNSVRSQSAGELIQWLEKKKAGDNNIIIGGDFNSVPFSKAIRIMGSKFNDALWPSLKYLKGTYKRLGFPIAPRIDFLFLSPNLMCSKANILPISPGDHFPVVIEIGSDAAGKRPCSFCRCRKWFQPDVR